MKQLRKSSLSHLGFPGSSVIKNLPACRRSGFHPWVRRCPGGGHDNPLQYSCPENPMDRGTWWAIVHGVAKGQIQLKQLSTRTHTHTHTHTHNLSHLMHRHTYSTLFIRKWIIHLLPVKMHLFHGQIGHCDSMDT